MFFNLFSNRPKKDCLIHFNKISIYEHLTIPLQTDHWEDECWVLSTPGQLCSVCSVPGHAAIVHSTQDYALRKVGRLSHTIKLKNTLTHSRRKVNQTIQTTAGCGGHLRLALLQAVVPGGGVPAVVVPVRLHRGAAAQDHRPQQQSRDQTQSGVTNI